MLLNKEMWYKIRAVNNNNKKVVSIDNFLQDLRIWHKQIIEFEFRLNGFGLQASQPAGDPSTR
jgi:hypothetical protein